jgi:acetyl esterase/lipase
VWGSSAGGHLAALCALTNGDSWYAGGEFETSSDVLCAVPICAPTDFLIDWYAVDNLRMHEEAEMILAGLVGGTVLEQSEMARKASPLWQVSTTAVPQLFIQGGTDDLVPAGQVRAYVAALMQHGADVTYLEYTDEGHAVDSAIYLENEDHLGLRGIITAFFRWHLESNGE